MYNNSPLESLAAFAIAFAAGAVSVVSLSHYVDWIKRKAQMPPTRWVTNWFVIARRLAQTAMYFLPRHPIGELSNFNKATVFVISYADFDIKYRGAISWLTHFDVISDQGSMRKQHQILITLEVTTKGWIGFGVGN